MNSRCEEFQTMMAARLGESSETRRAEEIRQHLEGCSDCREYFRALRTDDELLTAFTGSLRPSLSRLEDRTIGLLQTMRVVRPNEPRRRRMRDVCATVAAAAVLCIVAALAIRFFGVTGVSSVGLARTLEAMKGRPWIHSVHSGPENRRYEYWQRWDGRVIATRSAGGAIRYTDYADNVHYEYNRNANKITISLFTGGRMLTHDGTPLEMAARIIKSAEEAGAKISYLGAGAPGTETEVIRVDYPDGWPIVSSTLTRDTATSLLLRTEYTKRKGGQEVVETATFDYPDLGPADIYTLGVPADAIIYDTRPTGPAMDLVKRIQERFERGFDDHQAVLLESQIDNDGAYLPHRISVFRQKGRLKRRDDYHAFNFQGLDLPYPGEEGRWPHLSMPQMFDILSTGAMKPVRQMLFDGSRTVTRNTDGGQTQVREAELDLVKGVPYPDGCLASLAWPNLYPEIQMGLSIHSEMEVLVLAPDPNWPGWVGLRLARSTQTRDYWFDPDRDYLLMERITIRPGVSTLREFVKELGQTPSGVWYPRVIEVEATHLGPDGVPDLTLRSEKRILLETGTAVDDVLFDPASLTR